MTAEEAAGALAAVALGVLVFWLIHHVITKD